MTLQIEFLPPDRFEDVFSDVRTVFFRETRWLMTSGRLFDIFDRFALDIA